MAMGSQELLWIEDDSPEPELEQPVPFKFVDLFAGIGGFRLGLSRAGGTCVYSCEIDDQARRTYEVNFGPCDWRDVRTLDPDELPDHDVLSAGFPCQPFSLAGVTKKTSLGLEHGFQEARSGNLFFEIVRILRAKNPKVVLMENVKNLLSHDGGRTMTVILGELDAAGYETSFTVIDARAWVPQHRERTFLVGLHRDRFQGRRFDFPPGPVVSPAPRLRDILDPWWDPKYVLSEGLWSYLQSYREKHRLRGNGFGFGLFGGDDIARTLSARYHKDGSEILIDTASSRPRRLTPAECARLMGFPKPRIDRSREPLAESPREPIDEFIIPVSDTQAYRQFGNSVVVGVVEHLGLAVARQLSSQGDAAVSTPKAAMPARGHMSAVG